MEASLTVTSFLYRRRLGELTSSELKLRLPSLSSSSGDREELSNSLKKGIIESFSFGFGLRL